MVAHLHDSEDDDDERGLHFVYRCKRMLGLEKVHNHCTLMRSCAGLQESIIIYGAEKASTHCLEMEPLTFGPAHNDVTSHHTCMHRCRNTHSISSSGPFLPSSLSSVEFESKMNLSVTGQLQLQKHGESDSESRGAGNAGTVREGGHGAKEDQLFNSPRSLSDFMCMHVKMGHEQNS